MLLVRLVILLFSCFVFNAVHSQEKSLPVKEISYSESAFEEWKIQRQEELTAPFGWLSLTGLYWIKEDVISIGSASSSDIVLAKRYPENLGTLFAKNRHVEFVFDTTFQEGPSKNPIKLLKNGSITPNKIEYGSLQAYLILRNDKLGLRTKDSLANTRSSFKGLDYFPYNPNFIFEAELIPSTESTVMIENVMGMITATPIVGNLRFQYDGKTYQLIALDGGPETYFVIFSDKTTGLVTYGGGRYIDVSKSVDNNGKVVIDFNRAYNPPCVFTDFATCPLPPDQNKLDIAINAGETYKH